MRSVERIINRSFFAALALFLFSQVSAQENSPFSRYGLGDIYPTQSIAIRGMGGVAAGYVSEQALNSSNPSSYSALRYVRVYGASKGALVTYDFGVSIDTRNLRSASPVGSYKSTNFIPSYVQLGIPLSPKGEAKKRGAGLVFGLRPATRINYSVQSTQRTAIDSVETLYQGNGGLNQVFFGLGKRWNNFSIGFNAGYQFGRKEISTKQIFINDTVNYYKSNTSGRTDFWGVFLNPGIAYNIKLSETKSKMGNYKEGYFLRLGASGTLEQKLKANTNNKVETFAYDANGAVTPLDSIQETRNILGHITVPLTYNAGFLLSKKYLVGGEAISTKWSFGVDYSSGKWVDYRFYNQPDQLVNSWMIKAGGEFVPSLLSTSLLNRATYRAGFYTGKDYINADGHGYNVKAITLGMGFNLRKYSNYDNQSSMINAAIEFGKRGSSVNNVTENFFKFSVGFSLSDLWFTRRKYD